MYNIDYSKIPSFRKTSNIGKHAPGVYICPHCDADINECMMGSCKGFGLLGNDTVIVFECPKCGERLNYHAGDMEYGMYMSARERLGLP